MTLEQASVTDSTGSNASKLLAETAASFGRKLFQPHAIFRGGHAQTLAAYVWPRRFRFKQAAHSDEVRLFQIESGIQLLALCRWQSTPSKHATIVLWHGMEGSAESVYMLSSATKAFRAGFNVVRVNFRNCGGTEHLSPTFYHGGMSGDLRAVITELIITDKLTRIYPIGFSLGGNIVLKLAGEYAEDPPPEVIAVSAVSPSVDLRASTDSIIHRRNWIYHRNFVKNMKKRVRTKHRLFPGSVSIDKLSDVKTIRDFDEIYTASLHGFADANDYYLLESSIRVANQIRIPTLVIHAKDDPFIPFTPLEEPGFRNNPFVLVIGTQQGGHVAFISRKRVDEDRFWAENRAIEFCQIAETLNATSESV
ncbi:MAG: YheT family hydrolase [Pyrinomonadaceae bacterium]